MSDFPAFAWLFPLRGLVSQNGRKFPSEWVCASELARPSPSELLDASTWLVARHRGKQFLFGHMVAEKAAVLTEGMNAGALILSADKEAAFRVLPRDSAEYRRWELREGPSEPGIFPASPRFIEEVRGVFEKTRAFTHAPAFMSAKSMEKSGDVLAFAEARTRYLSALRTVPLGEMKWRASAPDMTPYAHAAIKNAPRERRADLNFWIKRMDERISAIVRLESAPVPRGRPPVVDLEFDELDINAISARTYASSGKATDWEEGMSKTRHAEEAHQKLVGQLAEYLLSLGLTPHKSRSVDVAVFSGDALVMFEMKSATDRNFERQARRGIIQILEYGMWAKRVHRRVLPILVMPRPKMSARMEYVRALAGEAGVEVFFYSESECDKFPRLAERLKQKPIRN